MYVRLAFGVAAHLEPEILIVDEVLAVGDVEFQKKALGKMQNVSTKEGRTVLFVSHNMTAMATLCKSIIYMKNGFIDKTGEAREMINYYLNSTNDNIIQRKWDIDNAPGDEIVRLLEVKLSNDYNETIDSIDFYEGGNIEFTYVILKDGYFPIPNIHVFNQHSDYVFVSNADRKKVLNTIGTYTTKVKLPHHFLNGGGYMLGVAVSTMSPLVVHFFEKEALRFDVIENMEFRNSDYRCPMPGIIRPVLDWRIEKISR